MTDYGITLMYLFHKFHDRRARANMSLRLVRYTVHASVGVG